MPDLPNATRREALLLGGAMLAAAAPARASTASMPARPAFSDRLAVTAWGESHMSLIASQDRIRGFTAGKALQDFLGQFDVHAVSDMSQPAELNEDMAARMGAVPALLGFPGNVIPASTVQPNGSNGLAVTCANLTANPSLRRYRGTVGEGGIEGVLWCEGKTFKFRRLFAGQPVQIAPDTPFLPADAPARLGDLALFWIGTNTLTHALGNKGTYAVYQQRFSKGLAEHKLCTDFLTPATPSFLVFGQPAQRDCNADYVQAIRDYNTGLLKLYGERYIDIFGYFASPNVWYDIGIKPTQADRDAQTAGRLAPSLTFDGIHLLPSCSKVMLDKLVKPRLKQLYFPDF